MSVSSGCRVLSSGLRDGLIIRPEESTECDVSEWIQEPPTGGLGPMRLSSHKKRNGNNKVENINVPAL